MADTFRNHTGYGRTRRPKSIGSSAGFGGKNDQSIFEKETATKVTIVAAAALENALQSVTPGENGYSTENQRYLHIQIENDAVKALNLYAYNYAFGAWAVLYIYIGVGDTETAEKAYVAAQIASIDGKKLLTIPIMGIDRIGFTSEDAGNIVVRAACSSF